jgi:hypothetical protein
MPPSRRTRKQPEDMSQAPVEDAGGGRREANDSDAPEEAPLTISRTAALSQRSQERSAAVEARRTQKERRRIAQAAVEARAAEGNGRAAKRARKAEPETSWDDGADADQEDEDEAVEDGTDDDGREASAEDAAEAAAADSDVLPEALLQVGDSRFPVQHMVHMYMCMGAGREAACAAINPPAATAHSRNVSQALRQHQPRAQHLV